MVEAIMSFTLSKPCFHNSPLLNYNTNTSNKQLIRQWSCTSKFSYPLRHPVEKIERGSEVKVNALPDWPLMAVLVEHTPQGDLITHTSVWHLSDTAIKNVYMFYIMFTVWGCCFFGAAKDPYYDSEEYRKDGGDGTGYWVYEKQEDIEESSRAELWRDELIEEIELKVGSLRELEEAGRKEELVK